MIHSRSPVVRRFVFVLVTIAAWCAQAPALIRDGNRPPFIGDGVENHNIAWSISHGHGYGFDWDDPNWRTLFAGDAVMLARHGAGPTASRPPLVPLLGAVVIKLAPMRSFVVMRVVDAGLLWLAALLICAVASRAAGATAGVVTGLLCAVDPVRLVTRHDVWMTEPLSVFLIASLIFCLSLARLRSKPWMLVSVMMVMGALGLTRGSFLVLMPGLALVAAWMFCGQFRWGLIILAGSCLLPLPWWARNCAILDAPMPLGTQAGFNAPDEYSDQAVAYGGVWTGAGMRAVALNHWGDESLLPELPGNAFPSPERLSALWPNGDTGFGWMIYAFTSGNIGLERDLARAGQWAGIGWIIDHPLSIPRLMLAKLKSEIAPVWMELLVPFITAMLTLIKRRGSITEEARPPLNMIVAAWTILLLGLAAIALTHSVSGRFLVPYMPALYLLSGFGTASLFPRDQGAVDGSGGASSGTSGTNG